MANRAKLEAESDKLLAAHFADAIDFPTLKRHQDRIRAGLADVSDVDRRLASQAFYTRLEITDDEQLRPHLAEPFATIIREAHDSGEEEEPLREHDTPTHVACSRKTLWVEHRGLEPLTYGLQSRRSTN